MRTPTLAILPFRRAGVSECPRYYREIMKGFGDGTEAEAPIEPMSLVRVFDPNAARETVLGAFPEKQGFPSVLATICFIPSVVQRAAAGHLAVKLYFHRSHGPTRPSAQSADMETSPQGRIELRPEGDPCNDRQWARRLGHEIE